MSKLIIVAEFSKQFANKSHESSKHRPPNEYG
jgi:hypothetical protein